MNKRKKKNLITGPGGEATLYGMACREARSILYLPGSEIKFDLQLFADDSPTGQRTEEATQHRRELARKEGNVAKSMDLTGMVTLLFAFTSAYYSSGYIINQTRQYFISQYSSMGVRFDELTLNSAIIQFMTVFFLSIIPILLCSVFGAIAICYYQVGFEYTLEPLMFNVGHMNPVNGFTKMISWQPVFEFFKSFGKVL
ncbi:MAG TPA: EscU/YscU/HrcU family type III secretion system export apparatus switch protein, partial [Candidatus Wallbacteria bacterium]|nr:EscU/YscU/HrcU family type III secretion system export apparatus switch protein [Candidatus Wallbacteria bacterium]